MDPCLVIFDPGMKNSAIGIVRSKSIDVPGLVQEGTPMSGLIVVTREWVDPVTTQ